MQWPPLKKASDRPRYPFEYVSGTLHRSTSTRPSRQFGEIREAVRRLAGTRAGVRSDRIRLTPSGWLRLDALAVALTSQRSR